mmetsp:Transcript_22825/g.26813  ORF Transcript_22825/g.26813 Transcript_22825/m.26813 type:complete len:143 (-) Transcript_22825:7-435(-)
MIEMNRITRLLHSAAFLTRQRRAITFSKKYVITERDLVRKKQVVEARQLPSWHETGLVSEVLYGFDPGESMRDRRILYEVTGLKVGDHSFYDQFSSDSEDADTYSGVSFDQNETEFVQNPNDRTIRQRSSLNDDPRAVSHDT